MKFYTFFLCSLFLIFNQSHAASIFHPSRALRAAGASRLPQALDPSNTNIAALRALSSYFVDQQSSDNYPEYPKSPNREAQEKMNSLYNDAVKQHLPQVFLLDERLPTQLTQKDIALAAAEIAKRQASKAYIEHTVYIDAAKHFENLANQTPENNQ